MIYHYTNIETLAQILKNKTLLFNRLDCVDDLEEGSVVSSGIYVGRYIFVSCWTETAEESIPLWKMYGGDKTGVRIGLKKDMFKKYHVVNPQWGGLQGYGSMYMSLPPDEFNKDYFVLPIQSIDNNDYFYRKVQYVDDVKEKTRNAVNLTPNNDGTYNANIAFGEIGRYKHNRWRFQDESRFVLTIMPINPFRANQNEVGTIALNACLHNKDVGFTKYFMNLDEDVLSNIEITLSPNASDGHKILVDALVKLYAPNAVVKFSSLGRLVKM